MLKNEYDVVTMGDGAEAIRYVSTNPPDVVLLDIKMPGVDGMEVLKEIKKTHPDVEVVMITAFPNFIDADVKQNVFDYIIKPPSVAEVRDVVRRCLVRQKQQTW
jgi:DNA-binding NtrC family response regulator